MKEHSTRRIGSLEITLSAAGIRVRDRLLLSMGQTMVCLAFLSLFFAQMSLWLPKANALIAAVVFVVLAVGLMVSGITCVVKFRRRRELASLTDGVRIASGIRLADDATVHVEPSGASFAAIVLHATADQIVLAKFRWRCDAEELALCVAQYLRLPYVNEAGDVTTNTAVTTEAWPPRPNSSLDHPKETHI